MSNITQELIEKLFLNQEYPTNTPQNFRSAEDDLFMQIQQTKEAENFPEAEVFVPLPTDIIKTAKLCAFFDAIELFIRG